MKKGIVKKLGAAVLLLLILGLVGTLFICIPSFTAPNPALLICIWLLSLTNVVFLFWHGMTQSLLARVLAGLSFNALILLAGTIHNLQMSFIGLGVKIQLWAWVPLLVYFFVLVWVLPIINEPLAQKINNRLLTPQTFLEKNYAVILLLSTIAMCIGLYIYDVYHPGKIQGYVSTTLLIAVLSYVVTLIFSQTAAYQIWAKHQNQDRSKVTL